MRNKRLYILLVFATGLSVNSATSQIGGDDTNRFYNPKTAELRLAMTGGALESVRFGPIPTSPADKSSLKKAGLGVLFSAVVPGSGQMYAGSWIKGSAFLAVEVTAWAGYKHYYDKGNEMRTEFRNYADMHWSETRWRQAYDPTTEPFTHELPDTKTQQYYEMIGKYNQFKKGWDDWVVGSPDLTPRRDHYETMRHDHNHQLINASRCAMAVLGNHLLSALDAAWTIHRRNQKISARVDIDQFMVQSVQIPMLSLKASW